MLGLLKEEENSSRHILRVQDVPTHPSHGRLALLHGGDVLAGEVAGDQVGVDQAEMQKAADAADISVLFFQLVLIHNTCQ